MKKTITITLLTFLINVNYVLSSPSKITSSPISIGEIMWSNDVEISDQEPVGKMSGIQNLINGNIYVAINDTTTTQNFGLLIFESTDLGATWSRRILGVTYRGKYENIKLVNRLNSVYCFFLADGYLNYWDISTANVQQLPATPQNEITDFDVAATNGNFYLIAEYSSGSGGIGGLSSTDAGATWATTITNINSVARPKIALSNTGEKLVLNYYSNLTTDTVSSDISSTIYSVDNSTATLTLFDSSQIVVAATVTARPEFCSVMFDNKVWLIYSEEVLDSDIKCKVSTDTGSTFGAEINLANTTSYEYWFDAKYSNNVLAGAGGINVCYYFDGSGPPNSDEIRVLSASNAAPETFFPELQTISEHTPIYSEIGYSPVLIELYNSPEEDFGVVWVGEDGVLGTPKVYWDNESATLTEIGNQTSNNFSSDFKLYTNYPNPFNPNTKISFEIPQNGFVTLKIYNSLGKEIQTLASKEFEAGIHDINFDASNLSSGTYFYKVQYNGSQKIGKMVLQK